MQYSDRKEEIGGFETKEHATEELRKTLEQMMQVEDKSEEPPPLTPPSNPFPSPMDVDLPDGWNCFDLNQQESSAVKLQKAKASPRLNRVDFMEIESFRMCFKEDHVSEDDEIKLRLVELQEQLRSRVQVTEAKLL